MNRDYACEGVERNLKYIDSSLLNNMLKNRIDQTVINNKLYSFFDLYIMICKFLDLDTYLNLNPFYIPDLDIKAITEIDSLRLHEKLAYSDNHRFSARVIFRDSKDKLIQKYYAEFNKLIFFDRLQPNLKLKWGDMKRTIGVTIFKHIDGELKTTKIKLNSKIIRNIRRLRNTLAHEMCHAAVADIDKGDEPEDHGRLFWKWGKKFEEYYNSSDEEVERPKKKVYRRGALREVLEKSSWFDDDDDEVDEFEEVDKYDDEEVEYDAEDIEYDAQNLPQNAIIIGEKHYHDVLEYPCVCTNEGCGREFRYDEIPLDKKCYNCFSEVIFIEGDNCGEEDIVLEDRDADGDIIIN